MMNPAEFANIAGCERDLWWYRGMREILFRTVDPYLRGRTIRLALEAGCGTGYFSHLLQTERSMPVTPMDLSSEGLRYAQGMGVERLLQADITQLPFGDGTFDAVFSMDVLPHIPRGEESTPAREMSRVLAPGGLMVIRSAAFEALRNRHSQFVLERQRFTRPRLVNLMAKAGIRPLRCTYANSLLLPIAFAKFRVWEPLLGRPPASGVEPLSPWLDGLLYSALAMEARWIGAGHGFPAGQSVIFIGEKIE